MLGDFVIQVRFRGDSETRVFEGRIEQIDTGQSAHFHTLEELEAFVVRHLPTSDLNDSSTQPGK